MHIPYGKQHITEEDIEIVNKVLLSDALTQGPAITSFENAFANYAGSKYAVAVCNGTAALHLCALVLNIREGSNVIVPSLTFSASANCVRYCGANVWFADIDTQSYTISIDSIKNLLESKPKDFFSGLIAVDFAGYPVNVEELKKLADEYNLWLLEDACHAPGGYFIDSNSRRQICGNGEYVDLAVFSFHPVKHITSGEGGMITTNNENHYKKLLKLRTHGITRDPDQLIENQGGWYYEMQELGYNYRLTDFQAALGESQLRRAESGLKKRREIAAKYYNAFKDMPEILSQSGIVEGHAYHLYVIRVKDRKGLYNYLKTQGIYCQIHYIPVHTMPYYRNLPGGKDISLPATESYYSECLSLPMFPTLTEEEQSYVISKITAFFGVSSL